MHNMQTVTKIGMNFMRYAIEEWVSKSKYT
jgi:hypothetical protein